MIISHKHRFVFIEVPKTGTTSISATLVKNLKIPKIKTLEEFNKIDTYKDDFKVGELGEYETHMNISRVLELHPEIIDYFKFAFVRNPFDREVSRYHFFKNGRVVRKIKNGKTTSDLAIKRFKAASNQPFKKWIRTNSVNDQLNLLEYDGKMVMDYIGKFENMEENFKEICTHIGIPEIKLFHKNKSKHKHYKEYYNDKSIKFIEKQFNKDIKYFGYEF